MLFRQFPGTFNDQRLRASTKAYGRIKASLHLTVHHVQRYHLPSQNGGHEKVGKGGDYKTAKKNWLGLDE